MIGDPVLSAGLAVDAYLREHEGDVIGLVEDLVRTDSQIPPHADERAIVTFLHNTMEALGLVGGEILAGDSHRPNLVTRIRGRGDGPTLMLAGHVDTKPVGDARPLWHSDPLAPEIRDGRVYGLGTSDMKAAIAAMVFAAAALQETGTLLGGDLVLAFTSDEEAGSEHGAKWLAPRLKGIDACLIGEPSGWEFDWQGLHLVSRGVCCFRVRVHGSQMHSSLSDLMPSANASRAMAELLLRIEDELELEFTPHPLGGVTPTLNVGVLVKGGVYFGVVPGLAEFACDLRTVPGMTRDAVRASIERWAAASQGAMPEHCVEIEYEPGLSWVPSSEIPPAHPLVHSTWAAARDVLGSSPPLSVFPGATDAPWYDAAGIPTIPSFGPGILTRCHGPNEYVAVESVHQAARIYARAAARFCGIAPGENLE